MRSILYIILILIIHGQNDDPVKITIEVYSPVTDDSTNIFIAGNNSQMGNWDPGKIVLTNIGNNLWKNTFSFQSGSLLEYKITRGSYDNEAADSNGKPFANSVIKVKNDTLVQSEIYNWKSGDFEVTGRVTGEVYYHRNLKADTLSPRDVIVWLPPGYKENIDLRYPVLYMQDGQNIFDPKTAHIKVDWQLDEFADSLIRTEEIEPLIIVGIYNTGHRGQEYHPTPRGKLYRDFIINNLKPMLDKTYRTKPDPENTAVGGSSSGGILAFMLAWENPHVFSKAICMSPPLKYDYIDYVKNVKSYNGNKKNIRIYIDNGDNELDEILQPGITEMMKALDEKGYERGVDYFWYKAKNADHNEVAWAKRMPAILKLFYGTK